MQVFDLEGIIRKNIRELIPYSSARSEFEGEGQIFLDANENSLGSVLNENFHRYPDPLQKVLKEKISELKNIPTQNIFVGNGSDEAIDLLIRAFCNPSLDNILIFPPTYGMYEVCAAVNDVPVKKVLLTSGFQLNSNATKKAIDDHTKLIFICSPNNPTGNLINVEHIESLLQNFKGIVVIDEAYIDFAGTESWSTKLDAYPNLVVLQTFSKAWGLAALRIGTAFASEKIITVLNKIKPPYNISGIAQQLALQALTDIQRRDEKVSILISEKKRLKQSLIQFGFVKKIFSSDANFLLVNVNDAGRLYNYLLEKNIVVRNRNSQPLCENCLRITIGTPGENDALLNALKDLSVMKRFYVDMDAILVSAENLVFEKDVLHNLFRITKQLNYELIIMVEAEGLPVVVKTFEILKNESVAFKVENNPGVIDDSNQHITKTSLISWDEIYKNLKSSSRKIHHVRNTNETKIEIELNLDGAGKYEISTGLNFFNHMLEQFSKHSLIDLNLKVDGDLHIDEHHTIEDTAIALGEAVSKALSDKRGLERYGFLLPMDDCLAQVAIDFGGRSWLVWDANFSREYIGDVPTEMFYHFFKSFSDAAKCNLNIKAEGTNEHHKIESVFKAFARAVKMAVAVNYDNAQLPTTKGIL